MDLERWMDEALSLAREAGEAGEVPVGCVVIRGEEILGRGRNRREEERSALAHAEIEAIREACLRLGDWRLEDCALFVTLEPCAMCAGAILNARIPTVVYGLREGKTGACGSVFNVMSDPRHNHSVECIGGILADECSKMLSDFFKERRQQKKAEATKL